MAKLSVVSGWISRFLAQRWSKEIVLAIALTLAAAAFIAAAMSGTDQHNQDQYVRGTPPYGAAGK